MTGCCEIGGYFELERFSGKPYHKDAIALNSGRGCLAYLAELRDIETMWIPDFMCDCVPEYLKRIGVKVRVFAVGSDFLPDYHGFEVRDGEWMLIADYYGQLRECDVEFALSFSGGRLIVDETQGFFRESWKGADTFYSCRKWFGVADGAYLRTFDGSRLEQKLERDESFARMGFVLGRFERSASEFYAEASANNDAFADEPAKLMSPITENILCAVDYGATRRCRDENWDILAARLANVNRMDIGKPEGAFMYPLMTEEAQEIRRKLISKKIYIPCLWPNVLEGCDCGSAAFRFAESILPLPVDQRYGKKEMATIAETIIRSIESCCMGDRKGFG